MLQLISLHWLELTTLNASASQSLIGWSTCCTFAHCAECSQGFADDGRLRLALIILRREHAPDWPGLGMCGDQQPTALSLASQSANPGRPWRAVAYLPQLRSPQRQGARPAAAHDEAVPAKSQWLGGARESRDGPVCPSQLHTRPDTGLVDAYNARTADGWSSV
jgi:hypothetical protein